MAMVGIVRIDGKPYRFCGSPNVDVPALNQVGVEVRATTTAYTFEGAGVRLHVDFFSPSFIDDLDVLSRPVAFVRFRYESADGKRHEVKTYFDTTAEWVVNRTDQKVTWGRVKVAGRDALRIGTQEQPILQKRGDDLRIDWGSMFVVPPSGAESAIGADRAARDSFIKDGDLPTSDDLRMPRPANDSWPVLSSVFEMEAGKSQSVLLAYDDQFSLEWFNRPVPAYWRRTGESFESLLEGAVRSKRLG